ncbi:MAG: carboxylating nicotinate-nucleotide diphosphorylase [Gemmatimonadales bacterium]
MSGLFPRREVERIAAAALAEDGRLDITGVLTAPSRIKAGGLIEYRTAGVLSGNQYADAVARVCGCAIEWAAGEGSEVPAGTAVGVVRGELGDVLRAERPMLNLLQRASGIATTTRAFVDAIQGTRCRILHTRKTAPGLRALDVTAVLAGGGHRHRLDLSHEVMIKDNHWQALARDGSSLEAALAQARKRGLTALYVEVESVAQLELACAAGATRLLVDNQPPETVRAWGQLARERSPGIEIEATGGITLANVREYAEAGADFISIGALTHSVKAADIAIEIKPQKISHR